jgi:hypothetical protein
MLYSFYCDYHHSSAADVHTYTVLLSTKYDDAYSHIPYTVIAYCILSTVFCITTVLL